MFGIKKQPILVGMKATAVRGKDEIVLFISRVPQTHSDGIKIPRGYSLVIEPLYKEDVKSICKKTAQDFEAEWNKEEAK